MLKANTDDVKAVREFRIHLTFQTAMDSRMQATPPAVRSSYGKTVEQLGAHKNH